MCRLTLTRRVWWASTIRWASAISRRSSILETPSHTPSWRLCCGPENWQSSWHRPQSPWIVWHRALFAERSTCDNLQSCAPFPPKSSCSRACGSSWRLRCWAPRPQSISQPTAKSRRQQANISSECRAGISCNSNQVSLLIIVANFSN